MQKTIRVYEITTPTPYHSGNDVLKGFRVGRIAIITVADVEAAYVRSSTLACSGSSAVQEHLTGGKMRHITFILDSERY